MVGELNSKVANTAGAALNENALARLQFQRILNGDQRGQAVFYAMVNSGKLKGVEEKRKGKKA